MLLLRNTSFIKFLIILYFLNAILVMSIEQSSPIKLTPYCLYNQEIVILQNCSAENMAKEFEAGSSAPSERSIRYLTSVPVFLHGKSYPLGNFSILVISLIAKILYELKLYDPNIWLYVFNSLYFLLGPIVLASSFFLLKPRRVKSPATIFELNRYFAAIATFCLISIISILRIILGKGYPESAIAIAQINSWPEVVKGLIGPIFFAQGYVSFFGVEPRNFALLFVLIGTLFLLATKNIKYSYIILSSSVISVSQGFIGLLLLMTLFSIADQNSQFRKLIIKVTILWVGLLISTWGNLSFTVTILLQGIIIVSILNGFKTSDEIITFCNPKRFVKNFKILTLFFCIFFYIFLNILLIVNGLFQKFDFFVLQSLSYYLPTVVGVYELWGRALIQEGPGRFGQGALILIIYFFCNRFLRGMQLNSYFTETPKKYKVIMNLTLLIVSAIYMISFYYRLRNLIAN